MQIPKDVRDCIDALENAGLAGAPYPAKLKELLGQKQKEDAEHDIDA